MGSGRVGAGRGDGVRVKTGYIEQSDSDLDEDRRQRTRGGKSDEYWDDFL